MLCDIDIEFCLKKSLIDVNCRHMHKFMLKIHQNMTNYSYTIDVSVSIKEGFCYRPKCQQCKNNRLCSNEFLI